MKNIYLQTSFVLALVFIMTGNAFAIGEKKDSGSGFETGMPADSTLQNRYHDPGLKKVVQVAIVVRDIEASSKLWAELLGMPVPEISTTRPGHEVKEIYRGKP